MKSDATSHPEHAGGTGFDGFRLSRTVVGDVSLRVRHGGSGPPLLLLYGYPETHLAWGLVSRQLAEDVTVVTPTSGGYGERSKPAAVPDHSSYGKRAMAEDGIGVMRQLGFDRFDVVGHTAGDGWRTAWPSTTRTPSGASP